MTLKIAGKPEPTYNLGSTNIFGKQIDTSLPIAYYDD